MPLVFLCVDFVLFVVFGKNACCFCCIFDLVLSCGVIVTVYPPVVGASVRSFLISFPFWVAVE